MHEFPTPTPFTFDLTPDYIVPTFEAARPVAVNAVQMWNTVPSTFTHLMAGLILLFVIAGGILIIKELVENIE